MTLHDAMQALQALGTAQNRKIYVRHGAGENCFGVSFANLGKLVKQIKRDHALACLLWTTGNADARILATMVADPGALTPRELDDWVQSIEHYAVADAFSKLAAASPHAYDKLREWMPSTRDLTAQVGFDILAQKASNDPEIAESLLEEQLDLIEKTIHTRKNRTRHAMNNALIAIAFRNTRLRKMAVAAAKRIGKVEVDHGLTSCKTPDAVSYIEKSAAHYARKAATAAAKKANR